MVFVDCIFLTSPEGVAFPPNTFYKSGDDSIEHCCQTDTLEKTEIN